MEAEHPHSAERYALSGSVKDFAQPIGPDLPGRTQPFLEWQQARRSVSLWSYCRSTQAAPHTWCGAHADDGTPHFGINLASQDYLGLSAHPAVVEAARNAMYAYGTHSAGSAVLMGVTHAGLELEEALCDFMRMEHAVLFPTGWAAGYGVIQGLIRADDHVVIDEKAHACLQQGAQSATRNIRRFNHLDVVAVEQKLAAIRAGDTRGAILVVTESLFSMDADTPDLASLQRTCTAYGATLLVDVAHDLGATGVEGCGAVGEQGMLGRIDLLMGSFSKTFASNGGFVLTHSRAIKEYLRFFASTHIFSNALSAPQAAAVLAALGIVRSPEGAGRRHALAARAVQLRAALATAGLTCLGNRSPIVPVRLADEALARLIARALPMHDVIANLVEYPGVPLGEARLRLQLMATHTPDQIRRAAEGIAAAHDVAMKQRQQVRL